MGTSKEDKDILQRLAEEVAEIASLPIHRDKIAMWERLNGLERVKPMLWINEIPWHEMDVDDELKLQTVDPFCRSYETQLRQIIYQWKHMRGDMVVEPVIYCPLVIHDTGFGIGEDVDVVKTDAGNPVISRHFHPQIQNEDDIEKIKMPRVAYDAQATEDNYQRTKDIFDGILKVEKRGRPGFWFAPWDELIRWWGVQEAMMDMVLRPELVHKAMDRLVQANLYRLDQYEAMNLLALNNNNTRIGSGGLGYTDELPQADYNPSHIRPLDLWGNGTAQIFSDVSPQMHEEFALQYEIRWMKRFGLNYYGCCEPLHKKINILRKIPNLRKISMSPWADVKEGAANIGKDFVFSYKPSPAIFAVDQWDLEAARDNLIDAMEKTKECAVEIIMKDISTVRYKPQRLWEWAEMAAEVIEVYA